MRYVAGLGLQPHYIVLPVVKELIISYFFCSALDRAVTHISELTASNIGLYEATNLSSVYLCKAAEVKLRVDI